MKKQDLKFWFPFLAYSAIIFCVSSLPSDRAIIVTRFFWDKGLHTLEYFPLGISAAYAWANTRQWSWGLIWVASAVLCVLYGLSDEFHQSFVPGREASVYDVCADLVGASLGAGIYLFARRKTTLKRP